MILYIEVFIFMVYVIATTMAYGFLPSISESCNYLKTDGIGYLFTFFCFIIGGLHLTHGGVLFFLSGSAICFVGVATNFKIKRSTERFIHYWSEVAAIVLSLAALAFSERHIVWPGVVILILAVAVRREDNAIWWVELFSFLLIAMGVAQL